MTSWTSLMRMRINSSFTYGAVFFHPYSSIIRSRCITLWITGAMTGTANFVVGVFLHSFVVAVRWGTASIVVSVVDDDCIITSGRRKGIIIIISAWVASRTTFTDKRASSGRSRCRSAGVHPHITIVCNDVQLAQVGFEAECSSAPIGTAFVGLIFTIYWISCQFPVSYIESFSCGFIANIRHKSNELATGHIGRNYIVYRLFSQFVVIGLGKAA